MHVADVKDGEAIKRWRQPLEPDIVMPDDNALRVPPSAPIESGQLQRVANERMDRIPVLDVKEVDALAEDLRLVVRLDSKSQSRVQRSETLLQFQQDFLVHQEPSLNPCWRETLERRATCRGNAHPGTERT